MGHALRGAVTAWLSLIVLQAIVANGSGKVAGALAGVDQLVRRALDPTVPAIPDRRVASSTSTSSAGVNPFAPTAPGQQAYGSLPRPGQAGQN